MVPNISEQTIPDMIKGMKGATARDLFKYFPRLREKLRGGHLWNPSYFAATASDHLEQQIRDYIQSQGAGDEGTENT